MKYEHLKFIIQKLIMKIQPGQDISYKHNTYTKLLVPCILGPRFCAIF